MQAFGVSRCCAHLIRNKAGWFPQATTYRRHVEVRLQQSNSSSWRARINLCSLKSGGTSTIWFRPTFWHSWSFGKPKDTSSLRSISLFPEGIFTSSWTKSRTSLCLTKTSKPLWATLTPRAQTSRTMTCSPLVTNRTSGKMISITRSLSTCYNLMPKMSTTKAQAKAFLRNSQFLSRKLSGWVTCPSLTC